MADRRAKLTLRGAPLAWACFASAILLVTGAAQAQPAPTVPPTPPPASAPPSEPSERPTSSTPDRTTPITPGMSVQGRLSVSDLKLDDDSFYDVHTFEAVAGRQYRVLLASLDFDALLFVVGDAQGPDPKVWLSDDISDDVRDSEIVFTAPENGTYEILVNSYSTGETGRYRLALTWTDGTLRNMSGRANDPRLGGRQRLDTQNQAPEQVVPVRY